MKTTEFCYWLQGYFEMRAKGRDEDVGLTGAQARCIEQHLALVFQHDIDPATEPDPAKAEILQALHDGKPPRPQMGGVGPDGTVYRC